MIDGNAEQPELCRPCRRDAGVEAPHVRTDKKLSEAGGIGRQVHVAGNDDVFAPAVDLSAYGAGKSVEFQSLHVGITRIQWFCQMHGEQG